MGKRPRQIIRQAHDKTRLRQWNVIFFLDQTPPTKILLLKRSATKSFAPNKYTGIGGNVEPGESIEQSTYRELQEEVGITDVLLTHFADVVFDNGDTISCYSALFDPHITPDCSEGTLEWVPLADLFTKALVDTARVYLTIWQERDFALRPVWTVYLQETGQEEGMRLVKVVRITDGLYTEDMPKVT